MTDETNTTETPNSEETTEKTTSTEQTEQTKSSDTTEDEDKLDLGKSDADDKGDETSEKKDGDDDDKDDAENAEFFGAPAEGEEYQLELPEGVEVDKEALAAVEPIARQLNLSHKGMSLLASTYAEKVMPGVIERYTQGITQQVLDQRKAWEGEAIKAIKGDVKLKTATDDEISFDGKSVKQVQQDAARALDRLAPAGFREFLAETGLGQHPAMVALAYQAGKAIAEDTDFEGGGSKDTPKSRVEKYYPRNK